MVSILQFFLFLLLYFLIENWNSILVYPPLSFIQFKGFCGLIKRLRWASVVPGPHHGDHHLHAGGGQCPVQCGRHDPQDIILQDDWLLPALQPQHHHPGHGGEAAFHKIFNRSLFYRTKVYHTYMTAHIQEDFAPNEDDLEVERVDY